MPTFDSMKAGYANLYAGMQVTREGAVNAAARKIIALRKVYEEAERSTGAPWWFIGALHMREADNNLRGCLTNGEMIIGTGRKTRLETRGRGPFATFNDSAIDCAKLEGWAKVDSWTIERCLYEGEKFNGWGYIGRGNSPYVWAGSSVYHGGKYVSDGVYSSGTIDPQLGIAPVMKRVLEITGARKIPSGTSRSNWTAQWGKWTGVGGAGMAGIVQQFYQYATDWRVLLGILGLAAGAGVAFWYIERKKLNEYKQGRYTPSGEPAHDGGFFEVSQPPVPTVKAKKAKK